MTLTLPGSSISRQINKQPEREKLKPANNSKEYQNYINLAFLKLQWVTMSHK